MLQRKWMRGLRKGALLLAASAMAGVGFAGSAHAFSYSTADLVGVVVENSTELIVDLGNYQSFTSATFSMPTQFGGTASSAKFIALAVPNNADPNGIVTFSAASSLDVPGFDNPPGTMSTPIGGAMSFLDAPSNDRWFNRLNSVPAPDGTNIYANTTNELVLNGTTTSYGYTQSVDLGTDKINQTMPFSTALQFNGGATASGNLWTGQIDPNNIFGADLFTLNGAISAHDNGDGTITFGLAAVPEPGTLLLLGSGLMGLAVVGRRKKV